MLFLSFLPFSRKSWMAIRTLSNTMPRRCVNAERMPTLKSTSYSRNSAAVTFYLSIDLYYFFKKNSPSKSLYITFLIQKVFLKFFLKFFEFFGKFFEKFFEIFFEIFFWKCFLKKFLKFFWKCFWKWKVHLYLFRCSVFAFVWFFDWVEMLLL